MSPALGAHPKLLRLPLAARSRVSHIHLGAAPLTPDLDGEVGHGWILARGWPEQVRGERMPGVFDPSWATPSAAEAGTHRQSNAAGLSLSTARLG